MRPLGVFYEGQYSSYPCGDYDCGGELQGRRNGVPHWQTKPITQQHLASDKDGVHLSPGGELVFARAIFKKLTSLDWIR